MKKGLKVLLFISAIFLLDFISAAISDDMHLNVQVRDSSGTIQTGTFAFGFNISTASDCNTDSVVFANATTQATDARGIVSYYLDDVSLNFTDQYYLCYYRDGTLKSASQMARVPYAFNSKFLNGYQSGAFFPFNTSVTGDFDFNGGWEAGGITIQGGKIYADTGFFYNLSKLNLTSLNVNGSILPQTGFDDSFDIGAPTLRWRDLWIGGNANVSGTATIKSIISYDWTNVTITESQIRDLRNYISINTTNVVQQLINNTMLNLSSLQAGTLFSNDTMVGIGTTTPAYKLELNDFGTTGLSANISNVLFINQTNQTAFIGWDSAGSANPRFTVYGGNLWVSSTAHPKIYIGDPSVPGRELYLSYDTSNDISYIRSGADPTGIFKPLYIDASSITFNSRSNGSATFSNGVTSANVTNSNGDLISVPQGMVSFFARESCPKGWTHDSRTKGRYIVGTDNSPAGEVNDTVGTPLTDNENRASGALTFSGTVNQVTSTQSADHTHTFTSGTESATHTHGISHPTALGVPGSNYATPGSSTNNAVSGTESASHTHSGTTAGMSVSHTHTITPSGTITGASAVAGTNAPYVQYLVCIKD